MKKNQTIKTILFCSILLSVSIFILSSNPVSAESSTIFVDDNADPGWYNETQVHTIQEGVNNVTEGGTIHIANGNYTEDILVNKTVTITGESIENVQLIGTLNVTANETVIEFMTIKNSTNAGIFDESANSTYRNLWIFNHSYGLYIESFDEGTTVSESTIKENNHGIYTKRNFNNFSNNHLINNEIGLLLHFSNFNHIYNNYIKNNTDDLIVSDEVLGENYWNLSSITPGVNIIGGSNLGGNYWDDYTGVDNNADGIGDSPYLIYTLGSDSYYDEYPLTNNSNTPPTLGTPTPADESTNNPLELDWTIPINDNDGWISWNISCNNGQYNQSSEDTNGTKTLPLTNLAYSTTYTITVNATDWYLWNNQTYTFTTGEIPTIYVDDDAESIWYDETHVHTIQEAVNNASNGASIYVFNGTYFESALITKSVEITGEHRDGVICNGFGSWYGYFFQIFSHNVTIQNLTVTSLHGEGTGYAIWSFGNFSTFLNLKLENNDAGILIHNSNNVQIKNNIIQNNTEYGITLLNANNNKIIGNFIINNSLGIEFREIYEGITNNNENIFFNNYFDNIESNVYCTEETDNNWNISLNDTIDGKDLNIIGGEWFGGNYWNDYTGIDIDADGIGDEPYLVYPAWENEYFDFFPLTDNSNTPPTLGTPNPANESTNNPLELDWTIPINDNNGWISWNISCNNGQYNQSSEDTNGTKTLPLTNLAYSTTYTITVNATDWYLWTNETFTFTTKNKPQEKKPNPTNQPPVARSGGSYMGHPNEQITFNGENSYDPDGFITSYSWSFGDGATAQGEIVSHTYTSQGSYTVTLWVTDNKGKTDSSTSTAVIIKANNPPEIQSSANINPGELSTQLTVTVTDKDGDDISGTISWDDEESTAISLSAGQTITRSHTYDAYGSYSIKITANDGTTISTKTHTISLFTTEEDDSPPQGIGGFGKITTKDEDFIENSIEDRSLFGQAVENKNIVIPAATAVSILLLFLLNLLVEFFSDYSSEHVLDHKRDKQKKKKQQTAQKTFLNKKELLAVFVTTILLALVLTWTWVPDLSMFWSLFLITVAIVAAIIFLRETIRCYLCRKHNIHSEFYIWPLGGIMMIVSTLIGNTFSLAANHHYENNSNIKQCGKVNFTVALFMYIVVASAFIINLFYNSIILQMIVIVTILNLFIDLFPFKPMDGYETRKWNLPLWVVLYIIVFVSYVVVYFNLYP